MKVSQIQKRIADLTALIKQPNQHKSVIADLEKERDYLNQKLKDVKRCLFGNTFTQKL